MAITVAPFGTYSGITAGTGVTKATINTALDNFLALIPDTYAGYTAHSGGVAAPHPDFDEIAPATRDKLRAEIAAIQAAVTAA